MNQCGPPFHSLIAMNQAKHTVSNRWTLAIKGSDSASTELIRTTGTDNWSRSRVTARKRAQKAKQRKGGFLAKSGFSGGISSGKRYCEFGSDANMRMTRSNSGWWGNRLIRRLTHECVINPKHMGTTRSDQNRSTVEIRHAGWQFGVRSLEMTRDSVMGRWVWTRHGIVP